MPCAHQRCGSQRCLAANEGSAVPVAAVQWACLTPPPPPPPPPLPPPNICHTTACVVYNAKAMCSSTRWSREQSTACRICLFYAFSVSLGALNLSSLAAYLALEWRMDAVQLLFTKGMSTQTNSRPVPRCKRIIHTKGRSIPKVIMMHKASEYM